MYEFGGRVCVASILRQEYEILKAEEFVFSIGQTSELFPIQERCSAVWMLSKVMFAFYEEACHLTSFRLTE